MEFWEHPVESISLSEQQSVRDDWEHHQGSDFAKRPGPRDSHVDNIFSSPPSPSPMANDTDSFEPGGVATTRVSLHRKNHGGDLFASVEAESIPKIDATEQLLIASTLKKFSICTKRPPVLISITRGTSRASCQSGVVRSMNSGTLIVVRISGIACNWLDA
ncbi:hypothetical protein WN51_11789 [Melipona quadrifasciata]|uniref:Uncharacterized protein n=1 Tax=Melipona quadrifasciata TaxID=166423 RepID=A0A0N0U673_9HYME|nr:hypothetical protein WN51_11789 [Melipona quadrifasciata]